MGVIILGQEQPKRSVYESRGALVFGGSGLDDGWAPIGREATAPLGGAAVPRSARRMQTRVTYDGATGLTLNGILGLYLGDTGRA